jgi:hypothetical protein
MFAETIDAAIETLMLETREGGGSTVSARGDKIPDTGYMVGGMTDSLIFGADLIMDKGHNSLAYQMIMQWMSHNFSLATRTNTFLGGWIDTETCTMYVDLSEHFPSDMEQNAMAAAKEREEIAIWDLEKGEEIRIS